MGSASHSGGPQRHASLFPHIHTNNKTIQRYIYICSPSVEQVYSKRIFAHFGLLAQQPQIHGTHKIVVDRRSPPLGHIVFQGVEPFIKCVRHANSTEILAATLCVRSTIDRRRWKVARDYIDWKKEKLIWAMTINVWKNSRRLFGCLCVVFDAHRAVAKQNWALSSELSVEKRKLCSSRRLDWRRRRRRETPGRYFALPQWWSTHTHKRNIYTRENPVYRVVSRVWQ